MNRNLSIAAIILFSLVGIYFVWSAIQSRRKSEELLSKFEVVSKGLDSMADQNPVPHNYDITLLNNEIILLTDSLLERFQRPAFKYNNSEDEDLKRLLSKIQKVTRLEWDFMDSAAPDTITYWNKPGKFNVDIWLQENFRQQPPAKSIEYLRSIKQEAINNNY